MSTRLTITEIDEYIESDPGFARELMTSLIKSLREFRESLRLAVNQNAPHVFLKAHHKAKTALSLVHDEQLKLVTNQVFMRLNNGGLSALDDTTQGVFFSLCTSIIHALENEMKTIPSTI